MVLLMLRKYYVTHSSRRISILIRVRNIICVRVLINDVRYASFRSSDGMHSRERYAHVSIAFLKYRKSTGTMSTVFIGGY